MGFQTLVRNEIAFVWCDAETDSLCSRILLYLADISASDTLHPENKEGGKPR